MGEAEDGAQGRAAEVWVGEGARARAGECAAEAADRGGDAAGDEGVGMDEVDATQASVDVMDGVVVGGIILVCLFVEPLVEWVLRVVGW